MSMLAERKVKQKWSLNPRGKDWSQDSNKFGQKLLEKMGWTHGKGLGANLDGITDHIKVLHKIDSKGMGYKETNDQWTEHSEGFDALLQKLSASVVGGEGDQGEDKEIQLTSLEKKSQSSKVRVHYHKFTRGKDLSRYSEKDLANIFGKKKLDKEQSEESPKVSDEVESDGMIKDTFTYNGGSMMDYFKKKIPNFGQNCGYVIGNNGVLKKSVCGGSESDSDGRVGFGFSSLSVPKKRRLGDGSEESSHKINKGTENENLGVSNPAFNPISSHIKIKRHNLNTIAEEVNEDDVNEEMVEIPKKKRKTSLETVQEEKEGEITPKPREKKKKAVRKDKSLQIDNPNFCQNEENQPEDKVEVNDFEVKRKLAKTESKKEKPAVETYENPNFIAGQEENEVETSKNDFEVKRKRKKSTKKDKTITNPNLDISGDDGITAGGEFEVKRKKTKKAVAMALDNPIFDISAQDTPSVSDQFEVKRQKKKKVVDNSNNEMLQDIATLSQESKVKRKKKKKNIDLAMENPTFDISAEDLGTVSEEFEVKRKKKKETQELSIDNPVFDMSAQDVGMAINKKYEVKREEKKETITCAVENLPPTPVSEEVSNDLMLNVTATPVMTQRIGQKAPVKFCRTHVRFNDGTGNYTTSKKIENRRTAIGNDLTKTKRTADLDYVGIVGQPDSVNEMLPDGSARLKYKPADNKKYPAWMLRVKTGPKSSYRHLIKGDIILDFNNTNLHQIDGYAMSKQDCHSNE